MTFLTSTLQIYVKIDVFSDMVEYEKWAINKALHSILSFCDRLIVFVSTIRVKIH